jgi:uncharacterized protein (DUF2062 family)
MAKTSLNRRFRYFYLRLIRLRGNPHELALGMAFGIFVGMTPIIPLHMVVAVALALLFKASKITAAAGTWICNPLTIYPIYKYCYHIGSSILGLDANKGILSSVAKMIHAGDFLHMMAAVLGAGGKAAAAFLLGGSVLGLAFAIPSYFVFLYFFGAFIAWRSSRKLVKA